jgi:hypothetical protein
LIGVRGILGRDFMAEGRLRSRDRDRKRSEYWH